MDGDRRDRSVERGVEDGDVRNVRQRLPCLPDRVDGRRIVQRCELTQLIERCHHIVVEQRRLDEPQASVNDSMSDARDVAGIAEHRNRVRDVVSVDDAQLEAGGAGIDDEDPRPSVRPRPVSDRGIVLAVLARVRARCESPLLHVLP